MRVGGFNSIPQHYFAVCHNITTNSTINMTFITERKKRNEQKNKSKATEFDFENPVLVSQFPFMNTITVKSKIS